jgi:hypothetical protein
VCVCVCVPATPVSDDSQTVVSGGVSAHPTSVAAVRTFEGWHRLCTVQRTAYQDRRQTEGASDPTAVADIVITTVILL